jgi:hypothetical protein
MGGTFPRQDRQASVDASNFRSVPLPPRYFYAIPTQNFNADKAASARVRPWDGRTCTQPDFRAFQRGVGQPGFVRGRSWTVVSNPLGERSPRLQADGH